MGILEVRGWWRRWRGLHSPKLGILKARGWWRR